MDRFKHYCASDNAEKFWTWIKERGGVAVWRSINLSNPLASWSTPATIRKGDCEEHENDADKDAIVPYPKPTWQAGNEPESVFTDPDDIGVTYDEEVRRFRVGVRVCNNGLMIKCTNASVRKIRSVMEAVGEGSYHEFDYQTQEAVIYKPTRIISLRQWAKETGKI